MEICIILSKYEISAEYADAKKTSGFTEAGNGKGKKKTQKTDRHILIGAGCGNTGYRPSVFGG